MVRCAAFRYKGWMFRLAHLSDVHLGPLPDVSYRQLASKRITGYVNWHRNRAKTFNDGALSAIVADIKANAPDHIAVTGDLMNLALDDEIAFSTRWLETLGPSHDVSVVPGNHDAYVPGALHKASLAWRPWTNGEDGWAAENDNGYPYVRLRGPLAIIGVSSARATAPFLATGSFSGLQARRMGKLLDRAKSQGLCRVVLIHHPPVRGAAPAHKRLFGISTFQQAIARHGAELVLHGHTHLPTEYWIGGKHGQVPVIGVAAAGENRGVHKPLAQWNQFEIDGSDGDWRIELTRRGLTGPTGHVDRIGTHVLIEPARRLSTERQPAPVRG